MPPIARLVQQRHDADCTVAALAMLLSISYEEALLVMNEPRVLADGAWLTQIIVAAGFLGTTLRRRTKWDATRHEGIARVNHRKKSMRPHVVVIRRGVLFDTDYSIWTPDAYLEEHRASFGTLLQIVEESK